MAKQKPVDRRIRTIGQLKELAKDENGLDCFILLNGGLRSSKHIRYYPDDNSFYVLNLIDDSEQELTEAQILDGDYTNIGEAMEKGALIKDQINEVKLCITKKSINGTEKQWQLS